MVCRRAVDRLRDAGVRIFGTGCHCACSRPRGRVQWRGRGAAASGRAAHSRQNRRHAVSERAGGVEPSEPRVCEEHARPCLRDRLARCAMAVPSRLAHVMRLCAGSLGLPWGSHLSTETAANDSQTRKGVPNIMRRHGKRERVSKSCTCAERIYLHTPCHWLPPLRRNFPLRGA